MKAIYATCASALLLLAANNPVYADNHVPALTDLAKNSLSKWIANPLVAEQVKDQNAKTKDMSEAQIILLDKKWRAETGATKQPFIEEVLNTPLSAYLKQVKQDSGGLYTEIFVMDARGMNVGQSDATTDYWQGDEAKWQKTYLEGSQAIHVGDVEMDESTQQFQAQLSMSVVDPESGSVIGAVTVGVNLDGL